MHQTFVYQYPQKSSVPKGDNPVTHTSCVTRYFLCQTQDHSNGRQAYEATGIVHTYSVARRSAYYLPVHVEQV